jgi:hypothetical protein
MCGGHKYNFGTGVYSMADFDNIVKTGGAIGYYTSNKDEYCRYGRANLVDGRIAGWGELDLCCECSGHTTGNGNKYTIQDFKNMTESGENSNYKVYSKSEYCRFFTQDLAGRGGSAARDPCCPAPPPPPPPPPPYRPYARYGSSGGSDIRLKTNLRKTGRKIAALDEYTWDWNEIAKEIGVYSDPTTGVIAQEAMVLYPDVVFTGAHGYFMVDYGRLRAIKE